MQLFIPVCVLIFLYIEIVTSLTTYQWPLVNPPPSHYIQVGQPILWTKPLPNPIQSRIDISKPSTPLQKEDVEVVAIIEDNGDVEILEVTDEEPDTNEGSGTESPSLWDCKQNNTWKHCDHFR